MFIVGSFVKIYNVLQLHVVIEPNITEHNKKRPSVAMTCILYRTRAAYSFRRTLSCSCFNFLEASHIISLDACKIIWVLLILFVFFLCQIYHIFNMQSGGQLMISNDMFTLRRYKNLKRNKAEVETPTLQSLSEDNYDLPEIEQNNEFFPLFINFLEASHIISLVASCKNVWCLLILFVFFLNQIYCYAKVRTIKDNFVLHFYTS